MTALKVIFLSIMGLFSLSVGGWLWVYQGMSLERDAVVVTETASRRKVHPLQETCPTMATQTTSAYLPVAEADDARLTISGVIYASDMVTPLEDVWLEVWQASTPGEMEPYPPASFSGKYLSDGQGRYAFTTMRPEKGDTVVINYRLAYLGNSCPLMTMQLVVIDVPPPENVPLSTYIQHPIDLYLPVPPP